MKTKILVAFATTMSSTREVAGAVAEVQRALRDVWAAGAGKETHSERLATIIHGKEKKSWREN